MEYKFTEEKLKLVCLNLSDEIIKGDKFLNNEEVTVFNSSIIEIKNSSDLLIASRGWFGNIRSWDCVNFIILSLFSKDLKKKKQNILNIDIKTAKKKKFKEFKDSEKIVSHSDKLLKGPEDPRLFYYKDDIYILINDLTLENKRHMFVSKIDLKKLNYKLPTELCKNLSSNFEKNWGTFIHQNKLHIIYDINPLKVFELDDSFNCSLKININDDLLHNLSNSFPDLHFHIRNSTNLIPLSKNKYLGLGHGVLDYKNNTDINKYFISLIDKSKYTEKDKSYFKKFFKIYTGFFYKLDMEKKEITYISPFFQLPNHESKQELIFFPTSISLDDNNYINISYNVGDNRSYFTKLHLDIVKLSLYKKENIEFLVNHNININYYLELIRNIRKLLGFSIAKRDYYKFGNVNEIFASMRKKITKNKKHKTKNKTKKSNKKEIKGKIIYFYKTKCNWCLKFNSTWDKLKKNKNYKFIKINGPKNVTMQEKYNIQSYPSIIKIVDDSYELFKEERTLKNLRQFLK